MGGGTDDGWNEYSSRRGNQTQEALQESRTERVFTTFRGFSFFIQFSAPSVSLACVFVIWLVALQPLQTWRLMQTWATWRCSTATRSRFFGHRPAMTASPRCASVWGRCKSLQFIYTRESRGRSDSCTFLCTTYSYEYQKVRLGRKVKKVWLGLDGHQRGTPAPVPRGPRAHAPRAAHPRERDDRPAHDTPASDCSSECERGGRCARSAGGSMAERGARCTGQLCHLTHTLAHTSHPQCPVDGGRTASPPPHCSLHPAAPHGSTLGAGGAGRPQPNLNNSPHDAASQC